MKYLFTALIILSSSFSHAASCCGGGFSIPALILGDDHSQFTASASQSTTSDEVLSNGKWLRRQDSNQAQTLKLEGATLLSDSLQAGVSVPLLNKKATGNPDSTGTGDVSLYLGHESFAETSYSHWRPKGVTFVQLTLPTAPSVYDAPEAASTEVRGRGFYTLGAGVALVKAWKKWDAHFSVELHRSLARNTSSRIYGGEIEVHPGWGGSQTLGVGWNTELFRLGSAVSFLYEDPIQIQGATESQGSLQRNMTWSVSGSYMLSSESAITVAYSDQSLLGEPLNSSLNKTVQMSYQQRWPR